MYTCKDSWRESETKAKQLPRRGECLWLCVWVVWPGHRSEAIKTKMRRRLGLAAGLGSRQSWCVSSAATTPWSSTCTCTNNAGRRCEGSRGQTTYALPRLYPVFRWLGKEPHDLKNGISFQRKLRSRYGLPLPTLGLVGSSSHQDRCVSRPWGSCISTCGNIGPAWFLHNPLVYSKGWACMVSGSPLS